jgi:plasmid maintenance system antidote protein VapI
MAYCLKGMVVTAKLLDYLKERFHIETDGDLAKEIGTSAPTISRVRMGHKQITPTLILGIHEAFEMPIKDIKAMLNGGGDDRAN